MIEELRNGSSGDETSSYHSYHGNVVVIFIQLYGVFLIYSGGFGACYTHTHIYIYRIMELPIQVGYIYSL